MRANNTSPPSNTGIGNKFIINKDTLIRARKFSVLTKPARNPASNPLCTVSPSMTVICTGPDTAFDKSIPLNNMAILLNVREINSPVSLIPCQIAGKKENRGAS